MKHLIALSLIFFHGATNAQRHREQIDPQFLFDAINEYRMSNDRPAIKYDKSIQLGTTLWSRYIASDFRHPKRGKLWETIARARSKDELLESWKRSWPHKQVILSKYVTSGAVAVYRVGDMYYAVFRSDANKKGS